MFAVGLPNDIVYQEVKGVRIAWIGFSYLGMHNSIYDLGELVRLVHQARRYAKIVIVTFHGGAEGSDALRVVDAQEMYLGEKRGNAVQFARTAVEAGADLVLGHGPHVLRGVECYRDKLIVYSLGNFVGYQAFSTKRAAAVSMILDVTLDEEGRLRRVEFHPIRFTGEHLPETDPRRRALYLLNDLSQKPPLQNEGTVLPGPMDADSGYRAYQSWLRKQDLESQLIP
jgi:poly-gamma-glutamate capsule biosynthesis protein CapA/YwtB (metallophosphatase superfamily)